MVYGNRGENPADPLELGHRGWGAHHIIERISSLPRTPDRSRSGVAASHGELQRTITFSDARTCPNLRTRTFTAQEVAATAGVERIASGGVLTVARTDSIVEYRKAIRGLTRHYLKKFGLHRWRMTRLYIGIPGHIKKELVANYPGAHSGFYACVYPTGHHRFVMAVSRDIPNEKLENVIAHEVSHILLHNLWETTTSGRMAAARDQLEVACNRIADAFTRRGA